MANNISLKCCHCGEDIKPEEKTAQCFFCRRDRKNNCTTHNGCGHPEEPRPVQTQLKKAA